MAHMRNFNGRGKFRSNNNLNSRSGRGSNRIRYMKVDPRVLVKKANPIEVNDNEIRHNFADFQIQNLLKNNVSENGYITPTPIQDRAIPEILDGKDVMGIASTGTGKTAAFLIPLINKVNLESKERVLVITPTRELALQIVKEGMGLARGTRARFALIIGGVKMGKQLNELRRKPAFVVGTPGRLKDLVERGKLHLSDFRTIVLDEVDRMLDMGFVNEMRILISKMPTTRHSLFFSATMTDKTRAVANSFLHNPVTVEVAKSAASQNVNQDIVRLNGREKVQVLNELLAKPEFDKVLVFGRTKYGVERLSKKVAQSGFSTAAIHGNKSQNQRQRALQSFKRNEVQVLFATDVVARGIDIDNVSHVINYELPETYEDYIHRIGRTGRAGRVGNALTFID